MGLYSSFSISEYYDEKTHKKENNTTDKYKKPHQSSINNSSVQPKKSLYVESQEAESTTSEYSNIDFNALYKVGQMIIVVSPNGTVRTKKGRIVEIVDRDLMYVGMEDTYRDVNNHWLVDFVTPKDKIIRL